MCRIPIAAHQRPVVASSRFRHRFPCSNGDTRHFSRICRRSPKRSELMLRRRSGDTVSIPEYRRHCVRMSRVIRRYCSYTAPDQALRWLDCLITASADLLKRPEPTAYVGKGNVGDCAAVQGIRGTFDLDPATAGAVCSQCELLFLRSQGVLAVSRGSRRVSGIGCAVNVAWLNLWRIEVVGHNSGPELDQAERELAIRNLRIEIAALQPTVVLFVSGGFASDILT